MRKPDKVFKDFYLYVDHYSNGEVKKLDPKEITRPIKLPKKIQDSYKDRYGSEYDDLYFLPISPINVITKGSIYTKVSDMLSLPGRFMGHALVLKNLEDINDFTYEARGPVTEYHCLVPRKISYYSRKLYHNIPNLPDEVGYSAPVVAFEIPEQPYDQYLYVAKGMAVTKVGTGFTERELLMIPANSGPRSVAMPWPDTQIVHIWEEPEE